MRELKFRAWDKAKKIMVYDGDLYHWNKLSEWELKERVYPCTVTNHGITFTNKLTTEQSNNYIEITKDGKHSTYYSDWEAEQTFLNGIELMQYTGLEDENGKEIYEGDIVRGFWSERIDDYTAKSCSDIARVFWDETNGQWSTIEYLTTNEQYLLYDYCEKVEVIGNIYENPDLLK